MTVLVRHSISDGIGRLVLARPEAGNAVSPALISAFQTAVQALADARPDAILLEADGPNFCFGGDVQHLAAAGSAAGPVLQEMAHGFHDALLALKAIGAPIIAAVRGHAIGGGLGLCLASDVLIVSETARLSTGYLRLGLSADGGVSYFLTAALGARRALALLLDPGPVDAMTALHMGLAHRMVPDDRLDEVALGIAAAWTQDAPEACRAMKRLVEQAQHNDLEAQLDHEVSEITQLAASAYAQSQFSQLARCLVPAFDGLD